MLKENFLSFRRYKHYKTYKTYKNNKKRLKQLNKDKVGLKNNWYETLRHFNKYQPNHFEIINNFYKCNIFPKNLNVKEESELILICVVKNDLLKVKEMVKYHRSIGVQHFVFIDNQSTDGTVEWLKKQTDIDVFTVTDKYTTDKKQAWINRIIDYYGFNRWYLILDSDEFFCYIDIENVSIVNFIQKLHKKRITRVRSLMIDMYAEPDFYAEKDSNFFLEKCKFFDSNSYNEEQNYYIDLLTGGPRERIFDTKLWLTKYPLVYFEDGDFEGNAHSPFPYKKNKKSDCFSVIKHYKFLPSDIEKYRLIAQEGNYYNGSIEYKNYINQIDQNDNIDFFYDGTQEFNDSKSLKAIPHVKDLK